MLSTPDLHAKLAKFHDSLTVHVDKDGTPVFTKKGTPRKKEFGRGGLAAMLHVTERAKETGLPINPDSLVTQSGKGGQVQGLGRSRVMTILVKYGVDPELAKEGGRTNRGNVDNVRRYAVFLNDLKEYYGEIDLDEIQRWWLDRLRDFRERKGFTLKYDPSKSLRTIIRDLMRQALERQGGMGGTKYEGALLHHLVGAKLSLASGKDIEHRGFSVADAPSAVQGDFVIEKVAIHVTTTPSEALIAKCRTNIDNGYRPFIVTKYKGVTAAEVLSENAGLGQRIEIVEAEQFIATSIYELALFNAENIQVKVNQLVEKYNAVVEVCESDKSLLIMAS